MRHRDRINVHIEYPCIRRSLLRNLVYVAHRGHPGAQIHELADPPLYHEPDSSMEERSVGLGVRGGERFRSEQPLGELAIGAEVVRATQ